VGGTAPMGNPNFQFSNNFSGFLAPSISRQKNKEKNCKIKLSTAKQVKAIFINVMILFFIFFLQVVIVFMFFTIVFYKVKCKTDLIISEKAFTNLFSLRSLPSDNFWKKIFQKIILLMVMDFSLILTAPKVKKIIMKMLNI
jgi:hypothetical protein